MKKKISLFLAVMFLAVPAWGQYTPPAASAYTFSGASWSAALSSYGGQAISYAPPSIALYCYNTSLAQWVPWTSACTTGSIPGGAAGGDLYSPTSAQNYPNPYVASITHLTNGASPVNLSAPGLTVNAVANAIAPASTGATSGGTAGVSATNEAALTCLDSGGNPTLGVASANVPTITANQTIPWTFLMPVNCTSNAALWLKASGSFAYYTPVSLSASSFNQTAAATTYTAAASYVFTGGSGYPTSNTTGAVTLGGLTGYIYANGSSLATAATTILIGALPTGTATNQLPTGGVITAAGPTGGAATVPVITYNAAGQLTAVTTAAITPAAIGAAASGASTSVNGQSCALGGSCTVTAAPNAAINLATSGAGGVTGILPAANAPNTGAWNQTTPTPTCSSGCGTTTSVVRTSWVSDAVSGHTAFFSIYVTMSSPGTGDIAVTMPFNAYSSTVAGSCAGGSTGVSGRVGTAAGSNSFTLNNYNHTGFPVAESSVFCSGTVETQ